MRDFQLVCGCVLLALVAGAAPIDPRSTPSGPVIRITLEVDWSIPSLPTLPNSDRTPSPSPSSELSVIGGRAIDVIPWPAGPGCQARVDGSWSLGPAGKGRVRVLVEAPLGAELLVKAADQTGRMTLASLLDGPQRLESPSGVTIGVERLSWDAIQAELGSEWSDGTFEPGTPIPLSVGFNLLTPEAAEVNLRGSAELRHAKGGDPVWRTDWREVISTDVLAPPRHPLMMTTKGLEGTYVLEIKTSWEPLADAAGSRLGRWVRRRRNPSQTTSASRRMTLAVLGSQPPATPVPSKGEINGVVSEVDSIDLTRAWGHRPSATGRSPVAGTGLVRWSWPVPEAAMVDPSVRDRLRGWIKGNAAEPSILGPVDPAGLAWSAVGLRVSHPDRPHRLSVTVSGGHPASLGVAMVAGGGPGTRNRIVLDACVSGPPIVEGGPPSTFSWPVWPDDDSPVLVLVNRDPSSSVQVGSIALTELADLAPPTIPRNSERSIGLHLAGSGSLDRFGGGSEGDGPVDLLVQARNLAGYLTYCGASTVVLPEGLADRRGRRLLETQASEDSSGPDRLDLILRLLARRGCSAWVDVRFDGRLPGLPAPDSPEALADGLVRLDRRGLIDGGSYLPIHPRVRESMGRKVAEASEPRKTRSNLLGVLIRLGPGSTLLGGPDTGLDDSTYARFVAAVFEPGPAARIPGQGSTDPGRFDARVRYVEGSGRLPWLAWRSREVAATYAGLAEAARRSAPGAVLTVSTPGLEPGAVGDEARRVDAAGLGPGQAWRGVGLDLADWSSGDGAPLVFRGSGLSSDGLGHDLATSPELDELVASRPTRGVLIGSDSSDEDAVGPRLSSRPMVEGPIGDEPLEHAVSTLDARRVVLAAGSVAGQEERLRRFARVFTTLPAPPSGPTSPRLPSGVVTRAIRSGTDSYLSMANDTPYPILLAADLQAPATVLVEDLGRGVRLEPERLDGLTRLVIELPPFGLTTARMGAPDIRVTSVTPFPAPAVLEGMKAHSDDLWVALTRLNRLTATDPGMIVRPGPVNPGFEPDSVLLTGSRPAPTLTGWELLGEGASGEIDRDRPRTGRGSLRLEARTGPASVASEPFRPDARTTLTIRAWLRTDRADARVRVRIDGQASGRTYARLLEVPARLDWAESTMQATQIPEGGLDSARLRFELMGPGRLWLDDVSVQGDPLSESERLNARRDLMAALAAYREKRYADFARLSGSHWARHVASGPNSATVAGDRSGMIRTGDASALPPGKRLR